MAGVDSAPGAFRRGNESALTYDLKMAAWEWLYREAGCRVIGLEVKLEGPGGRIVDLAAVGPQNAFYIVEVKSSRSDFSRDDHTAGDFSELQGRERTVAGRTELAKETLRQAVDYAKETDSEAWRAVPAFKQALADYRRVAAKEDSYHNRIATFSTKFHDPKFLGIADFHYLIAPKGVVNRSSIPPPVGPAGPDPSNLSPCASQRGPEEYGHRLQFPAVDRPEQHDLNDALPRNGVHQGLGLAAAVVAVDTMPATGVSPAYPQQ